MPRIANPVRPVRLWFAPPEDACQYVLGSWKNEHSAGIAQLVERNLAKVEVDGSRPFSRSSFQSWCDADHAGNAGIAQLVERNLAKVEVDGSRPFSRSSFQSWCDVDHACNAVIAQLVERNLAKVEVDGSRPFSRSNTTRRKPRLPFLLLLHKSPNYRACPARIRGCAASVVKLVDTRDLKSRAAKVACRFDPGPRHQSSKANRPALLAFSSAVIDKPGTMPDSVDAAPLGWAACATAMRRAVSSSVERLAQAAAPIEEGTEHAQLQPTL